MVGDRRIVPDGAWFATGVGSVSARYDSAVTNRTDGTFTCGRHVVFVVSCVNDGNDERERTER